MNIKKDKILVVEDEVLIAKDIAEILKEVGYDPWLQPAPAGRI